MASAIRPLRPLAFVVTALCLCLAARTAAQRSPFRSSVDVVALTVTVIGEGGKYMSGLTEKDFVVLEEGRKQAVSFFQPEASPLAVSLLIDSSGSMLHELRQAQQAASD